MSRLKEKIKGLFSKNIECASKEKFKKISYSQTGEDLIIEYILDALKIKNPFYLEIGSYHPYHLSNTARFYERGARGICIEPDPTLFAQIKKARPEDICLNVGIGTKSQQEADFYLMSAPTLNTFSKEDAYKYAEEGDHKIKQVLSIPLISFSELMEQYCKTVPDFISLDTEGFDYEILGSIDFNKYRPPVVCVETLEYRENGQGQKITKSIDLMLSRGYQIYADTHINTIFIDKERCKGVL